jgi:acylphosphatase
MIERRFRVSGRVQAVGFRAWTAQKARELGVRGSVRNCADGTVEVEAVGTAEQVQALRSLLERGPRHAVVERVEESAGGAGAPDGFRIVG